MHNKNFRFGASIRAAFLAAALCCVSLSAHALAPSKGYNVAVTPDGKNFKIKFASDGTPTATTRNGSSGVEVTSPASFQLTPTTAIGVIATGAITGASMGGAVGAAIGALGALTVATLPGFVELFERAKHRVKPDGTFEKEDPTVCTVAPCTEYAFRTGPNGSFSATGFYSTPVAACQQSLSITQAANPGITFTFVSAVSGACNYKTSAAGSQVFTYGGTTRAAQPLPAAYLPSTADEAVAAITANAPTAEEVQALVDANFPPEVSTPTITGPARKFVGNTVEMFSPDEKRLIEQWKNMDYSTPGEVKVQTEKKTTVTSEKKTSTTVTVNPDGSTSTATTTTPAATRTETTTDDEEMPPEDPCKLFPARVGCAEFGEEPETPMPKKTENVTFTPVAFQSNATCPSPLAITGTLPVAGSFNYSLSYAGICNGAAIIRLFLLAGATLVGVGIFVGGLKS